MALTMVRGALRFIGGRISKDTDATIAIGSAVVGLRGGIAHLSRDGDAAQVVFLGGDYARVQAGEQTLSISRPGGVATIGLGGAEPLGVRYDGVAAPDAVAQLFRSLRSPGDGGARSLGAGGAIASLADNRGAPAALPVSTSGERSTRDVIPTMPLAASDLTGLAQTALFAHEIFLRDVTENVDFVDVGRDGVIRGQLIWRDDSDLDLYLTLPDQQTVAYFNTVVPFNDGRALASLDADNLGGVINVAPDQRVENIVVNPVGEGGALLPGRYVFFVDAFAVPEGRSTPYVLTVTPDGGASTERLTGALMDQERSPEIIVERQ
jgi:hypothetical protein